MDSFSQKEKYCIALYNFQTAFNAKFHLQDQTNEWQFYPTARTNEFQQLINEQLGRSHYWSLSNPHSPKCGQEPQHHLGAWQKHRVSSGP